MTAPSLPPVLTVLMAVILLAGIAFVVWLQVTIPRVERVAFPERALSLMVSRNLDLAEAVARAPWWERWLYLATTETGGRGLEEAIRWYREVADISLNPELHLELAILQGEAGHLDDLRAELDAWKSLDEPFPEWAELVRMAYLEPSVSAEEARSALAELTDALSPGWFSDRAGAALASHTDDPSLLHEIERTTEARQVALLGRVRALTGVESAVIALGLAALVTTARRRSVRVGTAALPPLWHGNAGVIILIWGGGLGLLLALAFLFVDLDHPVLRLISMPVTAWPLVVMAKRYLLAPHGIGLIHGFGLRPKGGARHLIMAVLAVLSAGLVGEWILGALAEVVDATSHWTEWFDADLVWGDPVTLTIALIEFVVFAPVLEELVFRGLLFGTLRRRWSWPVAGMLSAGIFAVAHGYGALGLLSVWWSGLLWAWIYEKTGSLLPNMLAHAINNLLVCISLIVLLRT